MTLFLKFLNINMLINDTPDDFEWILNAFKKPKKTLNVASLFSGIGSFEHALHRLSIKHQIKFAGDIDKFCKQAYLNNYKIDEEDWHEDICEFSAKKYKNDIDILVGGSPCQSFSMVGKRGGLEDARGTLFYDFIRIVKECMPKVFIFENVKGLINHDNGNTWSVIKNVFNKLDYKIHWKVLNSKDYGIPQHRDRIFIIGLIDSSFDFKFPKKIPLDNTMFDFLEDRIDSKYYLKDKGVKFVTSTKNRKKRFTQINGEIAICQKANQQFNWHGDFIFEELDQYQNFDEFIFNVKDVEEKYFLSEKVKSYVLSSGTKNFKTRTDTDLEIARPLLQTMHKMHRAGVDNYITYDKGRIRKLTPRECLRLMGFRDSFKIAVSDTQTYRQAGNSIVVNIMMALIRSIDLNNVL